MVCKYKKDNLCQLTELFNIHVPVNGNWCKDVCGPDDTAKQLAMLERLGYRIPPPPDGPNLCEWATLCILNDQVELIKLKRRILAEIRRQELLEQLPKGFQLADNLKNHLGQIASHYIKTRRIKVSTEQLHRRLETCNKCPSDKMVIKDGIMRCVHEKCGCYLNNPNNRPALGGKAEYEALICDEGHWDKIDEQYSK
jgi:hypothetical protein